LFSPRTIIQLLCNQITMWHWTKLILFTLVNSLCMPVFTVNRKSTVKFCTEKKRRSQYKIHAIPSYVNHSVYSGRRWWCDRPLSGREFLDNFCTDFIGLSFVSRLNRKIRLPRLLVTVRVFCLLKSASWKKWFFSGQRGTQPLHHTTPPSTPTAPRPSLLSLAFSMVASLYGLLPFWCTHLFAK